MAQVYRVPLLVDSYTSMFATFCGTLSVCTLHVMSVGRWMITIAVEDCILVADLVPGDVHFTGRWCCGGTLPTYRENS
jgi:hypothetical protein